MSADSDRSINDLRQMDRETARQTLPVAEFERWEQLHDLHEQADETRQRWAAEDDAVESLTVNADMDQLGTEVDLYGNDVLVHVDSEDPKLEAAAEQVDDAMGDTDPEEVADLDDSDIDEVTDGLLELLDTVLVRWNGTDWNDLGVDVRGDTLAACRRKWGVDGLLLAWVDVMAAVRQDQEGKVSVVESFRQPERRGRR